MFEYVATQENVGAVNVAARLEQLARERDREGWELASFAVNDTGDGFTNLYVVFKRAQRAPAD